MTNQAWRIYYSDALAKTELTQSPARVKWAKEQGHRVVELVEKVQIVGSMSVEYSVDGGHDWHEVVKL